MKTFHIATLGCKINQYETQALREAWQARGMAETDNPEHADVILINSCAVTASAVTDLRQMVRSLARRAPGRPLVVTGCAAQAMPDELLELPGVAAVVPQRDKALLKAWPNGPDLPEPAQDGPSYPDLAITHFRRARPVLKVQDGCSHGCTYCIVPLTRGRSVSRPPAEVLAEARTLVTGGFRELILSGINLRHYGRDLADRLDFWDLLAFLQEELGQDEPGTDGAGRVRLRISSLDPGQLSPKALDVLAGAVGSGLVCPHLHLSIQSGSPTVLRHMGRGHYGPAEVQEFATEFSRRVDIFGLGADLLVGFPGETEAEFEETLALCRALPLSYAHVFPYSQRPGTRAADLPDQVPQALRKERASRLRTAVTAARRAFRRRLLALPRLDVVIEARDPASGVCEHYAECVFAAEPALDLRTIVPARPVGLSREGIIVEPLAPRPLREPGGA